jgi:hypothetical protein
MKGVEKLSIRQQADGAVLTVKAVPGSSRSRLAGVLGNALKVCVSAAPEKGRANAAIAELLAEALGVPSRTVMLVSRVANPRKEFLVAGWSAQQLRDHLAGL